MKLALPVLLTLGAALSSNCFADSIAYTVTGVLPSGTPNSSISASNASFTLTFTMLFDPVLMPGFNGSPFSVNGPAEFTMGAVSQQINDARIAFYGSSMGGGLFAVLANGVDTLNLSLGGPALFTGLPTTPVFSTGTFVMPPGGYSGIGVNQNSYGIDRGFAGDTIVKAVLVPSPQVQLISSAVPEPGETLLSAFAIGLAISAAIRKRREAALPPACPRV